MKQEPVAWMEDSIELYVSDRPSHIHTIPLYTAPKELSDEEIDDIYKSIKGNFWESAYKEFAKAILERAKK